jgi:hypothetical protein
MTDTFKRPGFPSETPEEREFELRAHIGSIWSGGRLFVGMYTFLVASLVFSFFYLRSSNNGNLWRLHDQHAPVAYGWAIYLLIVATALLAIFGQRRLRQGGVTDFQVAGWTGVLFGLVALFLQIWQLQKLSFYPGASEHHEPRFWCLLVGDYPRAWTKASQRIRGWHARIVQAPRCAVVPSGRSVNGVFLGIPRGQWSTAYRNVLRDVRSVKRSTSVARLISEFENGEVVMMMMQAVDNYIGPQVQTMVVLLGVLFAVCLWGFFQRHHSE